MMNKSVFFRSLLFTISLCLSFSIKAQTKSENTYKIDYELKYKLDTLQKDFFVEYFNLIVDKKRSLFGSDKFFSSLISPAITNQVIDMNKAMKNKTLFLDRIVCENGDLKSVVKHENVIYNCSEKKPEWILVNETKTIGKDKCRKAKAYFLGRNWIAWYSETIPINAGPYKFIGLPGLVYEVHDESETYIFSLVSIKKNEKVPVAIEVNDFGKPISKKEYFSLLDKMWYNTSVFTKFNDFFSKLPSEKIEYARKILDEKRKKRNNFPIDKDIN